MKKCLYKKLNSYVHKLLCIHFQVCIYQSLVNYLQDIACLLALRELKKHVWEGKYLQYVYCQIIFSVLNNNNNKNIMPTGAKTYCHKHTLCKYIEGLVNALQAVQAVYIQHAKL